LFDRTIDNGVHVSATSTGLGRLMLRGTVERSRRSGASPDLEALADEGEQPLLRRYDEAERTRTRATAMAQLGITPALALSATASGGVEDYDGTVLGLQHTGSQAYTIGVDLFPSAKASAGLAYSYEKYSALQQSRQADPGPGFSSPLQNWTADEGNRIDSITANADLLQLFPKTEIRLQVDANRSRDRYVFGLPAGSPLPPPAQWTPIVNSWQSATADVRYMVTAHFAIGAMYWYERYRVDDFARGPAELDRLDLPGGVYLGYGFRPYTANSAWVRAMYFW
jgi:hypothetical protein